MIAASLILKRFILYRHVHYYVINFILPSKKFIQCQAVIRNALKSSPNHDVNSLWVATSNGTSIQYDQYKKTKHVLTAIRKDHEDRINHHY